MSKADNPFRCFNHGGGGSHRVTRETGQTMSQSAGQPDMAAEYRANSITLHGGTAMSIGVGIGAGIFARVQRR